ncbi:MAG: bifunctional phosphopantothenoylcysteine decarboxylase/phosphopantothenate--cysteine ligase CoaBC [Clostridia bacterium]|nr:bifunctional phosphopantothenoylcysteine decarboxylase/phosphopantothenate--cysteine ligase CoaBC [Clostridia bacterium]
MLANKCIVVGVSGGIAAYKAAEVVSRLVKLGAEVHVIMTESAQKFIAPLTFQTLSRQRVVTCMWDEPKEWEVQHVALADKADAFLIAPATANIIGKIANGIADDMLSTTVMATSAPVIMAPAMNVHMYANPVVQDNIGKLARLGVHFVEPGVGLLACGYSGKGRLAEVEEIINKVVAVVNSCQDLAGKKVLVTAGPTREVIDPVRFISNRSTGKMGYAIARAARERGAEVVLVSGPTNLDAPAGVQVIQVGAALEMYQQVQEHYPDAHVVIKSAAVADYRPKEVSDRKVKKKEGDLTIELERNPDILLELGQNKGDKILVGFAAETNDLVAYARDKITRKNLDFIVANDVTQPGAGFGADTNIVKLLFPGGQIEELPQLTKDQVANVILDKVVGLINKV